MNHITSLLRGIIRTHVVVGLTFTAAITPLLAGNRPASETAAAPTVRNVVLVHGAFADGSSWAKVIPLLEAKGLHVTAVQNPLSSLADDVAATKRVIAMQEGSVILVGHSWAGMVISEAGNDPKVTGLVYVAAIVPDEGQSAGDVGKTLSAQPWSCRSKAGCRRFPFAQSQRNRRRLRPRSSASGKSNRLYNSGSVEFGMPGRQGLGPGLDDETVVVHRRQRPDAFFRI